MKVEDKELQEVVGGVVKTNDKVTCPVCGREYSRNAVACPYCGAKTKAGVNVNKLI